jgi:hypothetical protein
MAGLLNRTGATTSADVPQRTDAMASDAPTAESGAAEGESNVSPEEQAAYTLLVNKAYELVYNGGEVNPQVLESLKGNGDPIDGLANTGAMIVMRLEDSAKEKGKEFTPDVLYHGGAEIMEDLASLAEQAGIHEYSQEEMDGALYKALDIYRNFRQQQGGLHMDGIQQDMQAIMEAERSGELDSLTGGAGKKPAGGGGEEGKPKSRGLMRNG